jgi:hypothetical protein
MLSISKNRRHFSSAALGALIREKIKLKLMNLCLENGFCEFDLNFVARFFEVSI